MSGTWNLLIALLTAAALGLPGTATAAKPGGGGGGGGSAIHIEDLGRPAGSVSSAGTAINEMGNVVVGSAYWDATFEYPNSSYAARWTRNAVTGSWQAEDLRPLLPRHRRSEAVLVNDAGTVVINTVYADSTEHWFVATSAAVLLELAPGESVADLSDADQMVGARLGAPLYWGSPSSEPVELPVIQAGYGGEARWFQGVEILGILADDLGDSLVRWFRVGEGWGVERVQRLPPRYYVTGIGPTGRLALMHCPGPRFVKGVKLGCDWRAAVWDPPYSGDPAYLPNIAGSYSWTGGVTNDGAVVGVTVASNGLDMLPVLWPTPTTLVSLPLLAGGTSGGAGCCFNGYRQLAGHVDVPLKGRSQWHAVVWSLH
jgi:hypothetical protein